MKKFCVMIQAREDDEYFNNFSSEDTDVFILTFREKIDKQNYLYLPNSSWTEGRNFLLKKAYDEKYEYFIFLDDDARILNKDKTCGIENFKKLLLDKKPCVGFPDYWWHLNKGGGRFEARPVKNKFNFPIRFDQCCIAVSQKVIKDLFPYEDLYDKNNWWISGELMNYKCEVMIPESIIQFNEVVTMNLLSEDYPKVGHLEVFNPVKDDFFLKQLKIKTEIKRYPKDRVIEFNGPFKSIDEVDQSKIKISNFFNHDSYILKNNLSFWSDK